MKLHLIRVIRVLQKVLTIIIAVISSLDKHKEVVLGHTTTFFGLVWW
ncbi:hypothetical protein [Rickettsia japonica]|nr:hypothetical protein [Rickettsia japonica]QHE25172.1 hypothetical protein GRX81_05760 [Rickettsia japonica]